MTTRGAKTLQTPSLAWSIGVLPTRGVPRPQVALLVAAALAASLVAISPPLHPVSAVSGAGAEERAVEGYGNLPISFEPNVGQAPGRYDFVARGQGFGMAISATGATLALGTKKAQDLVRLNVLGASRSATPRALESLPGKVNYFIGNDPAQWRSDVPTFGRVAYRDVLPGIDVTYHGANAGTLEYDFVVAPDADPGDIRVGFSGASDVALRDGTLVITTANGAVTQQAPVLYQRIAGQQVPVDGRFSLAGDEVGFEVGGYDHHHPLVIDPTLIYSTYLGGSNGESAWGIAVDGSGAAYVAGSTGSTNFPTQSPFQGSNAGGFDAFVTKINASGSALIYSTYLGGSSGDLAKAIAVDGSGAAYVTGNTDSTDFPMQGALQGTNGGSTDAFITKLSASGSALIYSTYLGGSSLDPAQGIAVDTTGAAYVTGGTDSTNFPTQSPFQGSNAGEFDAFVTKINASGSALAYSTYLGGSQEDSAQGIAVDGEGAAYVTGDTWPAGPLSAGFPTQAPFQGSHAGGVDAFVTKLSATGAALIYSTYLGGSNGETGYGIAVDGTGSAYVTGVTGSTDFPMQAPFQGSNAGGTGEAFVTKLSATGSGLAYSTYLGGSGADTAYGIAVDGTGSAYVTGLTFSTNFPMQAQFQGSNAGSGDAFVTKLSAAGAALMYSTYLGGSSADTARGIAVDGTGAAYVAGATASTNFPTQAPLQGFNAGALDAFVTKLADTPAPSPSPSPSVSVSPSPTPTPSTSPSPSPSVSVSPSPTPTPSPSPCLPSVGEFVCAELVSGTVRIKTPDAKGYVQLRADRQVPIGSFVDTRGGSVRITAALPDGERQSSDFSQGLFQVLQSRKVRAKGLTELRLKGGSFAKCPGADGTRAARRRVIRRLRASARGRFRTRGRRSSATVRGTIWVVTDRCDGTLTKVTRGKVAVRDFRRQKTIIVRAGEDYLARRRVARRARR